MNLRITRNTMRVAPCVGAWIETSVSCLAISDEPSHPVWVRGLKHAGGIAAPAVSVVAPCVGAWIETTIKVKSRHILTSHPVWVRGLKHSDKSGRVKRSSRTLCGCVD